MRSPGPPNRFERLSAWQRGAVLAGSTLIICCLLLLAAEAAVRIRSEMRYGGTFWGVEETYQTDPATRLRIPVPNSRFGAIRINSFGFRSPQVATQKPADRLRVAFLGASTTYCAEVSSNAMTWPALVVKALHQHWPAVDLDYINAGVPGYTTRASLRRLELQVAQFKPDLIIIYHATNDLSANSYQLAHEQGVAPRRQEENMGWLSRHSLLVYLIDKNLEVMRLQHQAANPTAKVTLDQARLNAEFLRDYTDLVVGSQKVAKLVATVTFSPRIRWSETPKERREAAVTDLYYMPYMTPSDLLTGYTGYNQVVREVAKSYGAVLVGNEDSIPADSEHYVDSVHFTDAGSVAMANRVAAALIASPRVQSLVAKTARAVARTTQPPD